MFSSVEQVAFSFFMKGNREVYQIMYRKLSRIFHSHSLCHSLKEKERDEDLEVCFSV